MTQITAQMRPLTRLLVANRG
ncbi:MAG: hypothetical protein RIT46_950, partial [Pseudomonadota bacterium]